MPIAASCCGMEQSLAVGYRQRTFGIQVLVSSAERLMCSVSRYWPMTAFWKLICMYWLDSQQSFVATSNLPLTVIL